MAFAGSGTNVVVRSGQYSNRALDVSPTNKWDGPVLAAGLTGMPYFMAGMNLNTAGTLTAMLDTASGLLTLSGPTGAGFQLKGQWADAAAGSAGQYTHTFTAKGAVTLKSGSVLGDLTFSTLGQPLTITTKASVLQALIGEFAGMTWAGGLPLSTSGGSPLGSVLSDMGMDFSGGGMAWGIALGSDLKAGSTGLKDAPLNNAVPYLHVSLGSGDSSAASVSYGGNTASVGAAAGIHLALDPADPFFYAKVATGTVAGTWSAGYSRHGVIPFSPIKTVPGFSPEDIRGNVHVKGDGISLGDLPATVSGEVVLDLDADDNGQRVNVSGRTIGAVLKSGGEALGAVLNNVRLGVNGSVNLGYKMAGIDLSLPAGSGSLMHVPGRIGFHGGSDNPFNGTPLEKFAPRTGEIDLQGSINWGSPGWGFSLTGTQTDSTVGGLFGSKMSYTISNTGISATEAFSLDLGVAKADATAANFSMQYVDHALTLHVGLEANFEFGYSEFNLHGHLSLGLDLTTDFHGVNIRGHAEVTGGFTVGLISADFSVLKATVDNNGFAISLPCNNKLRVKW